jgi:uncharacterized protein with PIN domain
LKKRNETQNNSKIYQDKTNGETKFLCDNSIGKLTKHLRLLGVDCICEPDLSNFLLFKSLKEGRIILINREKILNKLKKLNDPKKINPHENYSSDSDDVEDNPRKYKFYFVKSKTYEEQLDEITTEFKIEYKEEFLYSRCLKCNFYMETFNFFDLNEEDQKRFKKTVGEKTIKHHGKELSYCHLCCKTFWNGWYFEKSKQFAMKHSYQK